MIKSEYEIRNVIICDDVRDEIGNKKSLMGVVSADILVGAMPAKVQIAIYFEFIAPVEKAHTITLDLFVDAEKIATAKMNVVLHGPSNVGTMVLPKGIVTFDTESTFRVTASINDGEAREIVSKRIMLNRTSADAPST